MSKRILTSLMMALVLVASLAAGTVASGAQQPPDLTKSFTWQSHGMSVAYPAGWTVTESDTSVRVRPDGRDVSDGFGPELVLFEQPDTTALTFDTTIADLAASFGAQSAITARTTINGSKTIRADLTWSDPSATGEIMLIAADDQHALGAAYVLRDSESAADRDMLAAMFDSITLGITLSVRASSSVSSVQLSQAYLWDEAGLTLHFPANWSIETETDSIGTFVTAYPDDFKSSANFHAAIFTSSLTRRDLDTVGELVMEDYGEILDSAHITVAGYEGVAYDTIEAYAGGDVSLRVVILQIPDRDVLAVMALSADSAEWNAFRPTVSALISSIEAANSPEASLSLVANTQPLLGGLPQQTEMQDFVWEDYGVSLSIPADWQSLPASQDYDLALVSPEAMTTGTGGFLIFEVYPTLGAGTTVETALKVVADQSGVEVEEYAPNGYGVKVVDEAAGVEQNLILFPYNDHGAALFVQASAMTDDTALISEILGTLTITPPSVDFAAADAAFQASLKDSGTLSYGDADAPVAVTEFFSFTCGHCANYTLPMLNFVALDVETGSARLAVAPLANDEKAIRATHALYCAAEQGKGYSVYEALFADYLTNGYEAAYTEESVAAILASEEFGLDLDTVNQCITDQKYAPVLNTVRQEFTDFGLTGTPTVVMGAHGDDIAPITFPDGSIWSGTMQIGALRTIVSSAIENNISTQDAANTLFEN